MWHKNNFLPSVFLLTSLSLFANNSNGQDETMQQDIVFTGYKHSTTIPPVKKMYDEDAKTWYAVYKTGNFLHVYLAITDPVQQRKIAMNGIELWIDTKGKKNKTTGIVFPYNKMKDKPVQTIPPKPENFNDAEGKRDNSTRDLEAIIAQNHEMKLSGFKEELNGVQNINHPSGLQAALYFVKDTMIYEAQLPLNTLVEEVAINSRIAIGIIEKGMNMKGMNDNGMPLPPDGGVPGGDGMMPPPGPPPAEEDRMRIFEDNIIWYKFSLQQALSLQ